MHTQEELIAFVPALLLLSQHLGFTPLAIVAMSLGSAAIGAAFGPVDPFSVLIAQRARAAHSGSGLGFRVALPRAGARHLGLGHDAVRRAHQDGSVGGADAETGSSALEPRDVVIVFSIIGGARRSTSTEPRTSTGSSTSSRRSSSRVGILAGLLGRLGVDGTAEAFVDGFKSMAYAALLVGFARAIYVVLNDGRIVDTLVNGLFAPIARPASRAVGDRDDGRPHRHPLPGAELSGHAVLTLPLLVPLSDLIGLSRQVTVLAYQYGAGLCEVLTPTNGALMAMLAAAGVRFEDWLRFALPLWLILMALAVAVGSAWPSGCADRGHPGDCKTLLACSDGE